MIDIIKAITTRNKEERFGRILEMIERDYILQRGDNWVNIIIPAHSDKKLALIAHYDVYEGSFGYNDNSSSVAILLSLQEFLNDYTEIVFTDREESGMLGVRGYLNENNPLAAINLDVTGVGDSIFYYEAEEDFPIDYQSGNPPFYTLPFQPLCDSSVITEEGIPNLLISASYKNAEDPVRDIVKTIHNAPMDNKIEIINEDVLFLIRDSIKNIMNKALIKFSNN